jgi:hypothetical protein
MNSIILNLETLNSEYNINLQKYEQLLLEYQNFLQQSQTSTSLISINNQAYWGSSALSTTSNISTVDDCVTLCQSNSKCSGATYSSDKHQCWLRSGDSVPIPSNGTYAIITQNMNYLLVLQYLNNKLTNINNSILQIIEQQQGTYDTQQQTEQTNKTNLYNNYTKLNEERKQIESTIKNLQNIDEIQLDSMRIVNKNYYFYILLLFIAIFVIIVLIKYIPKIVNNNSNVTYGGSTMNKNIGISITVLFIIAIIIYLYNNKIV